MDRSSKQKINKETMSLNDTLDVMNLTDIFGKFYSKTGEYSFFSSANGTFSRIDHILGHKKKRLNKYKKIEVILCTFFFNHKAMELGISNKKNSGNNTNTWRLSNMLLNNEWVNQ